MSTHVVLDDIAWKGVEPDAEALLEEWLVSEGDTVTAGQAIANVMLLKASYEIAAPVDGTMGKLLVAEDDSFRRGQLLAEIK